MLEDEDVLREMECSILQGCGYHILEAESGRKAFDLWQARGEQIDLLVADIVLPRGITGVEVAKHLQERQPTLKIIFATGRMVSEADHKLLARMNARFLPKPFQHEDLVRVVRETLNHGADQSEVNQSVA